MTLYLETVGTLPEEQQAHLRRRPAPLGIRLKFLGYALRSLVRLDDRDRYHHEFMMPQRETLAGCKSVPRMDYERIIT